MVICLLRDRLLFWIIWQVFSRSSGWISSVLTLWIRTGNLLGWMVASFVKIADTQAGFFSRKTLVVAVCTVLSYLSIGLGQEVEGGLVLAGEECQGV